MPGQIPLGDLFDQRMSFPDVDARDRLNYLVGMDGHIDRLSKILGVLVNADGLRDWAKQYHKGGAPEAINRILRRPPLVILAGDVGSGKTELAETIGDAVARQEKINVTLFPMSLSTRGQGRVGEMTQLLSAAFDAVGEFAGKYRTNGGKARGAAILLVDEADALAQSREATQMHHEDRAGVNAFIRGVDRLAAAGLPAAVIMCTNRISALDPAVKRRAADILMFSRPDAEQRGAVLVPVLAGFGFNPADISALVQATGATNGREYGCSFSDLTQRVLPAIVLDAYPNAAVTVPRALEIVRAIRPTPPFQDQGGDS